MKYTTLTNVSMHFSLYDTENAHKYGQKNTIDNCECIVKPSLLEKHEIGTNKDQCIHIERYEWSVFVCFVLWHHA